MMLVLVADETTCRRDYTLAPPGERPAVQSFDWRIMARPRPPRMHAPFHAMRIPLSVRRVRFVPRVATLSVQNIADQFFDRMANSSRYAEECAAGAASWAADARPFIDGTKAAAPTTANARRREIFCAMETSGKARHKRSSLWRVSSGVK